MIGQTNAIEDINSNYNQIVNYTMLYDNGNECDDITGGWVTGNPISWSSFTKNDSNLVGTIKTSGNGRGGVSTNNKINFFDYSKAFIVASLSGTSTTDLEFRLTSTVDSNYGRTYGTLVYNQILATGSSVEKKGYVIDDISKYGEVYVSGSVKSNGSGTHIVTLYNMCITNADDWQTLASIAGITASSIDDILTSSATLLSNEDAVKYMIHNCTGDFMISAVANETFLNALSNNEYKTIIQANKHWNKFLNMVV